jgi:hypothetical protein
VGSNPTPSASDALRRSADPPLRHDRRAAAAHQPLTPIVETLRGLMMGGPTQTLAAVAWCAGGIALGGAAAVALCRKRVTR